MTAGIKLVTLMYSQLCGYTQQTHCQLITARKVLTQCWHCASVGFLLREKTVFQYL